MFIRRPGVILTVAWIPVVISIPAIYKAFEGEAAGWLFNMLCLRAVVLRYLIWLTVVYGFNLLFIFASGRQEIAQKCRLRWREIINARVEGRQPLFKYEDTLDRAAQLKMGAERALFRVRRHYAPR
jgi:hypothetical protein